MQHIPYNLCLILITTKALGWRVGSFNRNMIKLNMVFSLWRIYLLFRSYAAVWKKKEKQKRCRKKNTKFLRNEAKLRNEFKTVFRAFLADWKNVSMNKIFILLLQIEHHFDNMSQFLICAPVQGNLNFWIYFWLI